MYCDLKLKKRNCELWALLKDPKKEIQLAPYPIIEIVSLKIMPHKEKGV